MIVCVCRVATYDLFVGILRDARCVVHGCVVIVIVVGATVAAHRLWLLSFIFRNVFLHFDGWEVRVGCGREERERVSEKKARNYAPKQRKNACSS